jgi:hypothetical protein
MMEGEIKRMEGENKNDGRGEYKCDVWRIKMMEGEN